MQLLKLSLFVGLFCLMATSLSYAQIHSKLVDSSFVLDESALAYNVEKRSDHQLSLYLLLKSGLSDIENSEVELLFTCKNHKNKKLNTTKFLSEIIHLYDSLWLSEMLDGTYYYQIYIDSIGVPHSFRNLTNNGTSDIIHQELVNNEIAAYRFDQKKIIYSEILLVFKRETFKSQENKEKYGSSAPIEESNKRKCFLKRKHLN